MCIFLVKFEQTQGSKEYILGVSCTTICNVLQPCYKTTAHTVRVAVGVGGHGDGEE